MTDYRKAVGLANNFVIEGDWFYWHDPSERLSYSLKTPLDEPNYILKSALAAQLASQVDGDLYTVTAFRDHTVVQEWRGGIGATIAYAEGPDRTDNTINAIVESGVLEQDRCTSRVHAFNSENAELCDCGAMRADGSYTDPWHPHTKSCRARVGLGCNCGVDEGRIGADTGAGR